jgi:hypothetical protein
MIAALALAGACSPQPAAQAPQEIASPSAPLSSAPTTAVASVEPPTVNGVYVEHGACPGEGCYLHGRIKAYEAVDLLERIGKDAPVIARIAANDWVEIVETEDRLIPSRGVVRKAADGLAEGDVVYMLGYEGEGCSAVWNKGAHTEWCDTGDEAGSPIAWDPAPPRTDPTLGFWVQVKLADGRTGWLSNESLRKFGCTGYQDRDADCPPLPN